MMHHASHPGSDSPRNATRLGLRRLRILVLLAAVAVALPACSALGLGGDENPFEEGAGEENIRVTIDNQNFKDATVWARWNGTRVRVGQVTGNTSRTFDIRYRSPSVSFEIDFLAGGTHFGRQIGVSPGDHVRMTIPPNV